MTIEELNREEDELKARLQAIGEARSIQRAIDEATIAAAKEQARRDKAASLVGRCSMTEGTAVRITGVCGHDGTDLLYASITPGFEAEGNCYVVGDMFVKEGSFSSDYWEPADECTPAEWNAAVDQFIARLQAVKI